MATKDETTTAPDQNGAPAAVEGEISDQHPESNCTRLLFEH